MSEEHEPFITLGDNAPVFLRKAADYFKQRKTQKQHSTEKNIDLKSHAGYLPNNISEQLWNAHLYAYKKLNINASQEGFTNMIINDTRITEKCFEKAICLGIFEPSELLLFKNTVIDQFLMFFNQFYEQHNDIINTVEIMHKNNKDFLNQSFESALSISTKKDL